MFLYLMRAILFLYLMTGSVCIWGADQEKNAPPCSPSSEDNFFFSSSLLKSALCSYPDSCIHLEYPVNFSSRMEVSGCYCECEGKILLLLRNPEKPQGNFWCIPGGKLEKGETPLQAVVREVWEETGLQLPKEALSYCRKVYVRFPNIDFTLHLFRIKLADLPETLNIASNEHSSYRWVAVPDALKMPLIPGGGDCMRLAFQEVKIGKKGSLLSDLDNRPRQIVSSEE